MQSHPPRRLCPLLKNRLSSLLSLHIVPTVVLLGFVSFYRIRSPQETRKLCSKSLCVILAEYLSRRLYGLLTFPRPANQKVSKCHYLYLLLSNGIKETFFFNFSLSLDHCYFVGICHPSIFGKYMVLYNRVTLPS